MARADVNGSPRRGIDVLPERVRTARREAGLSLAQLAAGLVTPVAIHLIESGKSRPSARTLMHIANRTGRPLGYFTDIEPDQHAAPAEEASRRAGLRMREATWAIGLTLRHPKLTRTEQQALRAVMANLRWSAGVVRTIEEELDRR
ncbi:MAG: helix-turn-helix transcriptional regulator [Candidatus Dormibacteraeota bacterium]|nr:helix-turn-helix transcriptional regulator [Candidatus Dormibacteraeota bacterium]